MKKTILILVLLCLMQSCCAQKKDVITTKKEKYMEPIITATFESFDDIKYKTRTDKREFSALQELSKNGNYLMMIKLQQECRSLETNPNSYFTTVKIFYGNGFIKSKGLGFNASGIAFKKGTWYEFDEQGKLIKEIDYDKNYKFTFEDILKFCEKEKIEVKKGPILQSTGFHTTIRREYSETTKKATWTIEHLKTFDIKETIALDGTTGAVLSRRESPFINN